MQEEFIDGIRVFVPHENAPEWVKFSGIINKKDLLNFLSKKGDEVRFQCKAGKKGGYYVSVDNWVPTKK